MSEHRVLLFECLATFRQNFGRQVHLFGECVARRAFVREEFVQRRVEQSDCYGQTLHCLEDSLEVFSLVGQELFECLFAFGEVACENHFADGVDSVALEEHMFCAAKSDTLRAELHCAFRLFGRIGVRADSEFAVFVRPLHHRFEESVGVALGGLHFTREYADYFARCGFDFAEENLARRAVD